MFDCGCLFLAYVWAAVLSVIAGSATFEHVGFDGRGLMAGGRIVAGTAGVLLADSKTMGPAITVVLVTVGCLFVSQGLGEFRNFSLRFGQLFVEILVGVGDGRKSSTVGSCGGCHVGQSLGHVFFVLGHEA
jgi:hypothetical protein